MQLAGLGVVIAMIWGVFFISQPSNVAWMYQNGVFVPRDIAAARKWYVRAAQIGDAEAAYMLAISYENWGDVRFHPVNHTPEDEAQILKWLRIAANMGNAQAEAELALDYEMGWNGLKVDYEESYFWYCVAATGQPFYKTPATKQATHLSVEQIEKVQKRAAAWKPGMDDFASSAEQGAGDANTRAPVKR